MVQIAVLEMPCFVPFDNKKLDVSFFVFRPTGVFADELIDAMKYFSFHVEDLGCVYSSVLKSMHGSLVIDFSFSSLFSFFFLLILAVLLADCVVWCMVKEVT